MPLQKVKQFLEFWIIAIGVLTSACEKEITIDLPNSEASYVVEGSIASGEPPFVFLTTSQPFFGSQSFNDLEGLFVHNASMTVSDDAGNSTALNELCINDLSGFLTNEELALLLEEFLHAKPNNVAKRHHHDASDDQGEGNGACAHRRADV